MKNTILNIIVTCRHKGLLSTLVTKFEDEFGFSDVSDDRRPGALKVLQYSGSNPRINANIVKSISAEYPTATFVYQNENALVSVMFNNSRENLF